ncbi:GntR family transcriptional regulator [Teredinibacter turnerae]|uniref:Transcriptional regulator, GntR family n=1 Tax=Teredinibacter turnerae (strain ATCC 39867 / T7901) TaxID=377629 RepID=C5BN08_TERTT|nr:GntR family transcriptional regulator [Teredinibacter turnerae]ACR14808.1 transcriptional regulator, GntR family [Teredinibacter turnerae T7901]
MSEIYEAEGSGLSRVELAYRQLKTNILSNEYPPGFQALEPEIAKKLGVSRTPVREALIRLEAEKLIELIPRRGMRVLPLVPDDIIEINQVLTGLECLAVELLAKKSCGSDVLRPMTDAVQEMELALENDAIEDWAKAEEKFHRLLISLAGNKRLSMLVENVRAQAYRARIITLKLRPKPFSSTSAYRDVFEFIARGDWQAAKSRHYDHRIEIGNILTEVLDRYQLPHL